MTISVLDPTVLVEGPSVAIGSDGLGLISYRDMVNRVLKVAHCDDLVCSSATISTLDASSGANSPSVAVGSDGLGLIAYQEFQGGVKVAHCDNLDCSASTVTDLGTASTGGWGVSLAIGSDGRGLISYTVVGPSGLGSLTVAHCDNLACTSAATSTLFTSAGRGHFWTSTATGVDGLGLIASLGYVTGDELRVSRCETGSCGSAEVSELGELGGADVALAIGSDDLGLIAYSGPIPFALRVAHCDDLACSSAAISELEPDFAAAPDLTIGGDGLGLITFVSGNQANMLKVAHCEDTICEHASILTVENVAPRGHAIATGVDGRGLIAYGGLTLNGVRVAHCEGGCGGRMQPTLQIAGTCPGPVTVSVWNAPPNSEVGVLAARSTNGWIKGGALCNGAVFEVGEPFLLPPLWIGVDGQGFGSAATVLPAERCWLEAIAMGDCSTSLAVEVPGD